MVIWMTDIISITVIITSRASFARVKTFLTEINNDRSFNLQIILSGSSILKKYGSVEDQLLEVGINNVSKVFNVRG